MEDFKKIYRNLEMRVLRELRNKVENSKEKAIKVNILHYTELSIVNDKLVLLDSNGYHYDLFTDTTLEDFIDILKS